MEWKWDRMLIRFVSVKYDFVIATQTTGPNITRRVIFGWSKIILIAQWFQFDVWITSGAFTSRAWMGPNMSHRHHNIWWSECITFIKPWHQPTRWPIVTTRNWNGWRLNVFMENKWYLLHIHNTLALTQTPTFLAGAWTWMHRAAATVQWRFF